MSEDKMKDLEDFMKDLKGNILSKIGSQKSEFDKTISEIKKIKTIGTDISNLEDSIKKVIGDQTEAIKTQFQNNYVKIADFLQELILNLTQKLESINIKVTETTDQLTVEFVTSFGGTTTKIRQVMEDQVKELTSQVRIVKETISKSVKNMELGALHTAIMTVVGKVLNAWLINVPGSLLRPIRAIQNASKEGLKETKENLVNYFDEVRRLNVDGIVKASIDINQQLKMIQDFTQMGVEDITESLGTSLLNELSKSIENPMQKITTITNSSVSSGDNMEKILTDIYGDFNNAVSQLDIGAKTIEDEKRELDKRKLVVLTDEKAVLEEERAKLKLEKQNLEMNTKRLEETKRQLEADKAQLERDKQSRDQKIGAMTDEQRRLLDEYAKLKVELQKFASAADEEHQTEYNFNRIKALLSIYRVLFEEIYKGQPEYKILYNLHGKKEIMSRDELKMATGVGGAFVLKALNELSRIGLLKYDMNTDMAQLKKRLFPKSDLDE